MPRFVIVPLASLLLVLAVGCSSSGGSGGSGGSGAPSAVCSSLTALKSSVNQLKQLNVSSTSVDQMKTKLTAVGNDIRHLSQTAKGHYSKQVDVIQHDYASFKSAVSIAAKNPTYPTIAQVKTSFTTLANSITHFAQTVAASC